MTLPRLQIDIVGSYSHAPSSAYRATMLLPCLPCYYHAYHAIYRAYPVRAIWHGIGHGTPRLFTCARSWVIKARKSLFWHLNHHSREGQVQAGPLPLHRRPLNWLTQWQHCLETKNGYTLVKSGTLSTFSHLAGRKIIWLSYLLSMIK